MSPNDLTAAVGVAYALQLGLGVIFLASALPKMRDVRQFTRTVSGYRLLPSRVTPVAATMLLAGEVFLAFFLLVGWLGDLVPMLAVLMLSVFLAAAGINLRRGRRVPCGCFGKSDEMLSVATVVRLVLLLAAAATLVVMRALGVRAVSLDYLVASGWAGAALVLQSGLGAVVATLIGLWAIHAPHYVVMLIGDRRSSITSTTKDRGAT